MINYNYCSVHILIVCQVNRFVNERYDFMRLPELRMAVQM